jgi:hypothetical protein
VIPETPLTHQTLMMMMMMMMMMTEMVFETSVQYRHLTWLIAREDYIKFIRRESSKTYIKNQNISASSMLTMLTYWEKT